MGRAAELDDRDGGDVGMGGPALAGPPGVSDDPQPTDYKHFEIYSFSNDTAARDGVGGESGIDFNYGAAPDLQLTATATAAFDRPTAGRTSFGYRAGGEVSLPASGLVRSGRERIPAGIPAERFEHGGQPDRFAACARLGSEGLGRRLVCLWRRRLRVQRPGVRMIFA
jgi:hypothetical protein